MTKEIPSSQARFLERLKDWPTQPGIYLMKDQAGRILYIGKAKNLRNRIRSYFQSWDAHTPKTRILVKKIADIEFTVTNTELEALLLECNLIKKHRPRYNVRLKDDKNFPYVVLDFTHPFPQFRISRKITLSHELKYFGPYDAGVKELGRFLLKTFQIRDCSDAKLKSRKRPCLNFEIGTCTAPCVAYVNEKDYAKQIKEATLFLQGKKRQLIGQLKKEMDAASKKQEYEQAKILRDKILSIEKISQEQNAILTNQQKDIDVLGCFTNDDEMQWVVLFIRNGFLTGRRSEKISNIVESKEEATQSFLEQFYSQSLIPNEIWINADFPGRALLEKLLTDKSKKPAHIKIKRSEKAMRLLGMAFENAKLIYQDQNRLKLLSASQDLQKALSLSEPPHTIEGIDVSNFQGELPAVAVVHFADERPLKSRYRLYYPKEVEGPNDFGMIYETVLRRFKKLDINPPPDLLLIDGGKGQLNSALKALQELEINIPICALAKSKTDSQFTRKEIDKTEERIFIPNRKNPIILKPNRSALHLLQQVRDEAHRFSVKTHRARRAKDTLSNSLLTDVAGIGKKKREQLLKTFGDIESISQASVEQLVSAGLSHSSAEKLRELLRSK